MDSDFKTFCAALGADTEAIQGAGGNISVKEGNTLHIKASGMWLREATKKNIFISVPLREILRRHNAHAESLADLTNAAGLRPSIETGLHALIPQRYVVHTHCVDTLAHSVHHNAKENLHKALANFCHALVPPARPGLPLALAVEQALSCEPKATVFILMNHGLVIAGETLEETRQTLNAVKNALTVPIRQPLPPATDLSMRNDLNWYAPENEYIQTIATDTTSLRLIQEAPLYPDHVVFLGPQIPVAAHDASLSSALDMFELKIGYRPAWMLFPEKGVLVSPRCGSSELAMLEALGRVAQRLTPSFAPLRTLSADIVLSLTQWEAERYRKQLNA